MDDNNTGQNPQGQVQNPDETEWSSEDLERLKALVMRDPERAARELKSVRREAGSNRKAADKLRELNEAAEAEVKRKAETQAQLEKQQGEWKAVADRLEAELAKLREDHSAATAGVKASEAEISRLKRYEEAAQQRLKARTEGLSETQKKRLPPLEDPLVLLAWIEDNADILQDRRPAPNMNQGVTGANAGAAREALAETSKQNAATKVRSMF